MTAADSQAMKDAQAKRMAPTSACRAARRPCRSSADRTTGPIRLKQAGALGILTDGSQGTGADDHERVAQSV